MSLTAADRDRLDEIRAHYPDGRAASISVMKWMQRQHGYISDESLRNAAAYLSLPTADLEGLATFYNLLFRKPVGRNVIKVCDSVSCWMCGYEDIKTHLQERLGIGFGETTPDGEFTLLPVVCLGDCDNAPVMMVNEDLAQRLTPARVDEVLAAAASGNSDAAISDAAGADEGGERG